MVHKPNLQVLFTAVGILWKCTGNREREREREREGEGEGEEQTEYRSARGNGNRLTDTRVLIRFFNLNFR